MAKSHKKDWRIKAREIMREKGITDEILAERLPWVKSTIGHKLRTEDAAGSQGGKRTARGSKLEDIGLFAEALGVPLIELVCDDHYMVLNRKEGNMLEMLRSMSASERDKLLAAAKQVIKENK